MWAFAPVPYFDLSDEETTLVVNSIKGTSIRLTNVLTRDENRKVVRGFDLINPLTEEYQSPSSFVFTPDARVLYAGHNSEIAVFDYGEGVLCNRMKTAASKRAKGAGSGCGSRATVTTLSLRSDYCLAAGTRARWVYIYDAYGASTAFSVADHRGQNGGGPWGQGITQVKWSPCGTYLYVAERVSDNVLIYDLRNTHERLGWLCGRKACTQQQMTIDLATLDWGGHNVFAGGTDGVVRVWANPPWFEGPIDPVFQWKAHDDNVTAVMVHPTQQSLILTASGQRHLEWTPEPEDSDSEGTSKESSDMVITEDEEGSPPPQISAWDKPAFDNTLKIWGT